MTKNVYFGPNLAILGPKIPILTGRSKRFGTYLTEKPPRHLFCIVFGRVLDQMPTYGQKCQFLGQIWWYLGDCPGHQKMTQNDNGPFPGANYGETAEKCFFGQKCILSPKHSKFLKRLIFILEKGTFFFERLFLGMARPWLGQKSEFFWGDPKSRFLAKIYDLCHTTPILVNGPTACL